MNAEKILIRTLLGDTEYRSVIYDVEPEILPRGISTPGNLKFKVENMTMFEEVFDAFTEEMNAAADRSLAKMDETGETVLTLEAIPQAAHLLAEIAYGVFFFGWCKMPEFLSAVKKDFVGCDALKTRLSQIPPFGPEDDFQYSLGLQIAGLFNKRVTAHKLPSGAAAEAVTPI